MTKRLLGWVCGLAMAAFVGSAWANEPVELTTDQLDQVTAGAGGCFGFCFNKHITGFTKLDTLVATRVKGGAAEAASDALAVGKDTATITTTKTFTDAFNSASQSYSGSYRN